MGKLRSYLQKKVNVHIDYIRIDGENVPDTFSIYITHRNRTNMLTNLVWEEIDKIIKRLKNDKQEIQLWRQFGIGKEVLDVPKWAIPMLAKKLREVKSEEEEKLDEFKEIGFDQLAGHKGMGKELLNNPLLISGVSGLGKTVAIQKLIPKLLEEGKKVVLIDFRNEYGDLATKHEGLSLIGDEANNIENPFVRIHFGQDVFYEFEGKFEVKFLSDLADKFDYLIIDDVLAFYRNQINVEFDSKTIIYDICSSLIMQNLSLKIIISLQSLSSLTVEDKASLQALFSHQLLFRQSPIEQEGQRGELSHLQVGQSVLFIDDKQKAFINFKG